MRTEEKKYTVPASIKAGAESTTSFTVTERMLERFAALTGDRNPLHTDEDFARKSIYRRTVVHGMLPVAFIALSDILKAEGFTCVPIELSAQFIEPAFPGEQFVMRSKVSEVSAASAKADFTIESERSGAAVTKGSITVAFAEIGQASDKNKSALPCPLVTEKMAPAEADIEEVKEGDADSLKFAVTEGCLASLVEILSEGTGDGLDELLTQRFSLPDLLTVLLFTTSVGMRLPGRNATFLEFNASLGQRVEIAQTYLLNGTVSHRSLSARMIKKDLTVSKEGGAHGPVGSGRVSVLVNAPPAMMPSIKALRENSIDMGIKDKVVLITGASRGIGETTAKIFALLGAKVVVNYYRGKEDAARIVKEIEAAGGSALAVRADVSDGEEVRVMVGQAVKRFGRIDVLVNNAVRDFRPASFLKLTWDDLQKDIDIVARGAFNCCKEVVPMMIANGGGKIINISTVATDNPPPNQLKYVLSKSALVGLTRSLAVDLASKNIQVNMVVPNFVETDLVSHIPAAYRKKIAQETPMKRNAAPEDVAHAVVFLASSYSSFTTGQKIMVTGGGAPYL